MISTEAGRNDGRGEATPMLPGPFVPVDLEPHLNRRAATQDRERVSGCFNPWGNSYPAEEMPYGGGLTLGGVAFQFPTPRPDGRDHLECWGGRIPLDRPVDARGLALACCGEMGDQSGVWGVRGPGASDLAAALRARPWLVASREAAAAPRDDCLVFSHLHYPGGYELDALLPQFGAVVWTWTNRITLCSIEIPFNPLFHVFAITIILMNR